MDNTLLFLCGLKIKVNLTPSATFFSGLKLPLFSQGQASFPRKRE
jgi:hypothetical protein